jgi:hypothetical protein
LVIQLQNQVQYICSGGLESKERIDWNEFKDFV